MKGNRCRVKETGGSDAKSLMWRRVPGTGIQAGVRAVNHTLFRRRCG